MVLEPRCPPPLLLLLPPSGISLLPLLPEAIRPLPLLPPSGMGLPLPLLLLLGTGLLLPTTSACLAAPVATAAWESGSSWPVGVVEAEAEAGVCAWPEGAEGGWPVEVGEAEAGAVAEAGAEWVEWECWGASWKAWAP